MLFVIPHLLRNRLKEGVDHYLGENVIFFKGKGFIYEALKWI
ncbi:hypothetical protein P278_01160 [Zhouia amylolytica AD3]|uniref:Uncharacterized protein n=1 Tax=Zhouia amylolytica AD3 TaxID=1286632 RepID=W2UR97_9FLAO|nr:hypothetical protein P278_01160 [Zhouia amylolytica AD3]